MFCQLAPRLMSLDLFSFVLNRVIMKLIPLIFMLLMMIVACQKNRAEEIISFKSDIPVSREFIIRSVVNLFSDEIINDTDIYSKRSDQIEILQQSLISEQEFLKNPVLNVRIIPREQNDKMMITFTLFDEKDILLKYSVLAHTQFEDRIKNSLGEGLFLKNAQLKDSTVFLSKKSSILLEKINAHFKEKGVKSLYEERIKELELRTPDKKIFGTNMAFVHDKFLKFLACSEHTESATLKVNRIIDIIKTDYEFNFNEQFISLKSVIDDSEAVVLIRDQVRVALKK